MKTQTISFVVQAENGVVEKIGKSFIETPPIHFKGGEVKWFDDSKLLKK